VNAFNTTRDLNLGLALLFSKENIDLRFQAAVALAESPLDPAPYAKQKIQLVSGKGFVIYRQGSYRLITKQLVSKGRYIT